MIYLDIETTTFFADPEIARLPRSLQLDAMARHIGVVVTYDIDSGYRRWFDPTLADAWIALYNGAPIVGWNIAAFDIPLLRKRLAGQLGSLIDDQTPPAMLDLFDMIRSATGRWYKLDEIASANLGISKSGDGQSAAVWLRSGDPELIERAIQYCERDVYLTKELHMRALSPGLDSRGGR